MEKGSEQDKMKKKCGGRGKRKAVVNLSVNGRRCGRRPLVYFNSRHSRRRALGNDSHCHPIPPRTSLVIFLKPALKFGFFILKALFTSKTHFYISIFI